MLKANALMNGCIVISPNSQTPAEIGKALNLTGEKVTHTLNSNSLTTLLARTEAEVVIVEHGHLTAGARETCGRPQQTTPIIHLWENWTDEPRKLARLVSKRTGIVFIEPTRELTEPINGPEPTRRRKKKKVGKSNKRPNVTLLPCPVRGCKGHGRVPSGSRAKTKCNTCENKFTGNARKIQ